MKNAASGKWCTVVVRRVTEQKKPVKSKPTLKQRLGNAFVHLRRCTSDAERQVHPGAREAELRNVARRLRREIQYLNTLQRNNASLERIRLRAAL